MKLKIIIGSVIAILVLSICFFSYTGEKFNGEKFSLEQKYYNEGVFREVNSKSVEDKIKAKESFLLYPYNNYCTFSVPCDDIFASVMKEYEIDILKIPFEEFKNTSVYKKIKFAPTVIIFKKGKVIAYLQADKDSDLVLYQNTKEFDKWLNKYLILKRQNKSN